MSAAALRIGSRCMAVSRISRGETNANHLRFGRLVRHRGSSGRHRFIVMRAWRRYSGGGAIKGCLRDCQRGADMSIQSVLLPVFVLVGLTFALLLGMVFARRGALVSRETKIRDIALG